LKIFLALKIDLMGFQILSKCPMSKPPSKTTKCESITPIGSRVVCAQPKMGAIKSMKEWHMIPLPVFGPTMGITRWVKQHLQMGLGF